VNYDQRPGQGNDGTAACAGADHHLADVENAETQGEGDDRPEDSPLPPGKGCDGEQQSDDCGGGDEGWGLEIEAEGSLTLLSGLALRASLWRLPGW
jgi:hypothetical protein